MTQKKPMRYTDSELLLIKGSFAENDKIVVALRKFFLQIPLSETDDIEIMKIKKSSEAMTIIEKTFLPELDGNAPLNQVIDLWMTLKIDDKFPEIAHPHILSRKLLISYFKQQIFLLKGGKIEDIDLIKFEELLPDQNEMVEQLYVNLLTRNVIITHTEQQLYQLNTLAGLKAETPEETIKRLQQDSSK
jgi:hypothetical protein